MSTPGSVTVSKPISLVNSWSNNHNDYEGPLAVFFAQYTIFEYNPDGSATDEFYRLCDLCGWDKEDQQKQVAKQGFQDALIMQFNDSYGTDVDDLTKWQALCAKLGMDPVPENLNACREVRKIPRPRLLKNEGYFRPSEARTSILLTWWIASTPRKKSPYSLLWSL